MVDCDRLQLIGIDASRGRDRSTLQPQIGESLTTSIRFSTDDLDLVNGSLNSAILASGGLMRSVPFFERIVCQIQRISQKVLPLFIQDAI
jgi:hypothetical protein